MTYTAYLFLHLDFATGRVDRASITSDKSPTMELGKGLLFQPPGFEATSEVSWDEAELRLLRIVMESVTLDESWGPFGTHVRTVLWESLLAPMRNR